MKLALYSTAHKDIHLNNKVYTLIMAGLYSSDHSLITDLVLPKLQHSEGFQIEKTARDSAREQG